MTQKIIFLRGLPGSGKTTFALDYISKNPSTVRVNKDDIRIQLHNGIYSKENEQEVIQYQYDEVLNLLDKGFDVIIDNTHLDGFHKNKYRDLAYTMGIEFQIKSFLDVPLSVCLERNGRREKEKFIPPTVIENMARKYGLMPQKDTTEFDKVIQGFGENAFIFDIDGTLSFMNGRNPHDKTKVLTDGCYTDIVYMLDLLAKDNRIIICTGRGAECREDTETWLAINNIKYDELFMRPIGDRRNDAIIKYEMLVNNIIPKYYVRGVFDDRDRVVKMWREVGLRCYQVEYGNF